VRVCVCVHLGAPVCASLCVSVCVLVSLCTRVSLYRWIGAFGCVCLRPYDCVLV